MIDIGYQVPPSVIAALREAMSAIKPCRSHPQPIELGGFIAPLNMAAEPDGQLAQLESDERAEIGNKDIGKFQAEDRSLLNSIEGLSKRTLPRMPGGFGSVAALYRALEDITVSLQEQTSQKGPKRNPSFQELSRELFVIYTSIT